MDSAETISDKAFSIHASSAGALQITDISLLQRLLVSLHHFNALAVEKLVANFGFIKKSRRLVGLVAALVAAFHRAAF